MHNVLIIHEDTKQLFELNLSSIGYLATSCRVSDASAYLDRTFFVYFVAP